jgi:hypothetical protein
LYLSDQAIDLYVGRLRQPGVTGGNLEMSTVTATFCTLYIFVIMDLGTRRILHHGLQGIEIVDEDLGRTASGTVTRAGFERMVAEVCLGHVGALAAREVSRFARNSREWQKLVRGLSRGRYAVDRSRDGIHTSAE